MFYKFMLLFTIVPLIELGLLIKVGEYIGLIPTVLLVAVTGIVGVSLAKLQGLAIILKTKRVLAQGRMPKDSLIDGVLVLIGAAMLLTPGLLTDIAGFSLILATPRSKIRNLIKDKFKDKIINIYYDSRKSGQKKDSSAKTDYYESEYQFDDDDVIDINVDDDKE